MARNKYDVDEALDIKLNKKHLKRAFAYAKPYGKEISICGFWMVVASCLSLMGPYCIQIALDDFIPQAKTKQLIVMAFALLGAAIISALIMRNRKIGRAHV